MEAKASRTRRLINPRKELLEIARIRSRFESSLEQRLARFFSKLGEDVADKFELSGVAVVEEAQIQKELNQIFLPFYRSVIWSMQDFVLRNLGIKTEFQDLIRKYLAQQGGAHIQSVSRTTRNVIMRAVRSGVSSGESNQLVARRIRDAGVAMSKGRARTIARTEIHSATTFANHEMSTEYMPEGTMKMWMATNDDRTRWHHLIMNGKQVPMDQPFEVMLDGFVYPMSYCGDPMGGVANTINCRCQTIYIPPDAEVSLTDAERRDIEHPRFSDPPWIYRENLQPVNSLADVSPSIFSIDDTPIEIVTGEFARKHGLTYEEIDVLYSYTGLAYMDLNRMMRSWFYGENISKRVTRVIAEQEKRQILYVHKKMKDALEKITPYKGVAVRKIGVDDLPTFMKKNNIKKGSIYRAEQVMSSAAKDSKFYGNVTYIINSKQGRFIDPISANAGEDEVLFLAGHEFKIDRVEQIGSQLEIYMSDLQDDIKADFERPAVSGKISRSLLKRMQSEAELASINKRLMTIT